MNELVSNRTTQSITRKFAQNFDIRDGNGTVQIHEKKNMVTDQRLGNNSQFVDVVVAWLFLLSGGVGESPIPALQPVDEGVW